MNLQLLYVTNFKSNKEDLEKNVQNGNLPVGGENLTYLF